MKKLVFLVIAIILFTACQSGVDSSRTSKGEPIAKIGNSRITVDEFQNRINKQNPFLRARYADREKLKEYLNNLVRQEVLFMEAQKLGFDRDPDVVDRMKSDSISKMIAKEFDEKKKQELVSDEDIKRHYEQNISDYNKPEAVYVRTFFVKAPMGNKDRAAKKKEAEKYLKDIVAHKDDDTYFFNLVKSKSDDDELKARGGELAYLSRDELAGKYGKEFADAAFSLASINDITPQPVETKDGFYIIKLRGKRQAINRTLDEVKETIRMKLYSEKRQKALEEWVDSLKKKYNVTVIDENLSKIKVDVPPAGESQKAPVPVQMKAPIQK
ncbi:MAG: peptidyl-prolyl cis-trans isomerase [Deltaproteobacteria bacterium]|nr:peptidyl-prolyl cis-trans isomerase [Deltaproteobacteria bacterium]